MATQPPMLADTHCHLYLEQFDADRTDVLARAAEAGVSRVLVPAIDLATSQQAIRLAEEYDEIYAAVGVHPNSASTWDDKTLHNLRVLAEHPKVVAIGEIGLDYYWDRTPREEQERVFRFQLELASEMDLPVIIHNREATDDVLDLVLTWKKELEEADSRLSSRPGVLHSYSGAAGRLEKIHAAGFYVGFTGPVTFRNAADTQEAARRAADTKILLETDAPFLAPEPMRGKRNEPQFVVHTARKLSELRGVGLDSLSLETSRNANALFEWQN